MAAATIIFIIILIRLLEKVYEQSVAAVRIGTDIGTWFKQSLGTKQGDPMSPLMFISYLERIMDNNDEETTRGIIVHGLRIDNLRFADDIDLLEESRNSLQQQLSSLSTNAKAAGLKINQKKTKSMVFGRESIVKQLELNEQKIENVSQFVYV